MPTDTDPSNQMVSDVFVLTSPQWKASCYTLAKRDRESCVGDFMSNHLSRSLRDITMQTVIFTILCCDNKGLKKKFIVWDRNKF